MTKHFATVFYIFHDCNAWFVNYSFHPKHAKMQYITPHMHKMLERRLMIVADNIVKFSHSEIDFSRTTSSVKLFLCKSLYS